MTSPIHRCIFRDLTSRYQRARIGKTNVVNEAELELGNLLAVPRNRFKEGKSFLAAALKAAKEQKYDVIERRDPETGEILAIEVWHGARQLSMQEPSSELEIPRVTVVALIAAIRRRRGLPR